MSDGGFRAYRIGSGLFPLFDGAGAALRGGRWNSPGRRVIYAGESFAIAMLETLVYTGIREMPAAHAFIEITVPAALPVEEATADAVPGWDADDRAAGRAFGDSWHEQKRTPILLVPSAVTRLDRNVLINPEHPLFGRIASSAPRPVVWDGRLFGAAGRQRR